MNIRRNLLGSAAPSIFSALVGPRPVLAPEDGAGGGAPSAEPAAGGDPAPTGTEPASEAKPAAGEPASALAGYKAEGGEAQGEKKPEGEGGKEGEPKPAEAAADGSPKDVDGNAIPESYEIKMPDGVEMDAELLGEVTPLFREARLSPAQAQVVADAYMKTQTDALKRHSDQTAGWLKDAKADPEIGGRDYDKNLGHAHRAFAAFGNERGMQLFDTYGLGNHPDILRIFVRMGKAIGEGGTVLPGEAGQRVSDAQALYPNMAAK